MELMRIAHINNAVVVKLIQKALIKKWIKKCDDDSETSNWISANTKECPKCGNNFLRGYLNQGTTICQI